MTKKQNEAQASEAEQKTTAQELLNSWQVGITGDQIRNCSYLLDDFIESMMNAQNKKGETDAEHNENIVLMYLSQNYKLDIIRDMLSKAADELLQNAADIELTHKADHRNEA